MSDDITFCANWNCKVTRCRRNRANVKHRELLHSYAWLEGTELCPDFPNKNKEVKKSERTT